MDDICESVPTVEEAHQLTKDLDTILANGGFRVKGWLLSHPKEVERDSTDEQGLKMLEDMTEEKILGSVWNHWEDVFSFKVKIDLTKFMPDVETQDPQIKLKLTKRIVLSQIARVFDPIGFAAAFLIRPKIGMQRLWQQGLDWDEDLPPEAQEEWIRLFEEMEGLNDVTFETSLTPDGAVGSPTLCIFSDASEDAFGACAYARWQLSNGEYEARFVAAKSRVAPLQKLTIPRLELQAAVLATRLCKTILEESRLQFEKAIFLSDSKIVLAWISSQARGFKPFVRKVPVRLLPRNQAPSGVPVHGRSTKAAIGTVHPTVPLRSVRLLWAVQRQVGTQQDDQALRSDLHVSKHKSRPFRNDRRLLNHGVHASPQEVLRNQRATSVHDEWQWIATGRGWERATRDDQRMEHQTTPGLLRRERHGMEIHNSSSTTPEWLCRSFSQQLQDCIEEGHRTTNPHPARAVHLSARGC